jgi:paraquat-inducible protein B
VELKEQIAATVTALKNATTDAEVQKLSAVLTGLTASLQSTEQETSEALATAMVQDIENRNDDRKQALALREQQSAGFSEALDNYGKTFRLLDAPTTFPK